MSRACKARRKAIGTHLGRFLEYFIVLEALAPSLVWPERGQDCANSYRNVHRALSTPIFEKGGKLERLYPLFEAGDTFARTPGDVTKGAPHVRDSIDQKRLMIFDKRAYVAAAFVLRRGLQIYIRSPCGLVRDQDHLLLRRNLRNGPAR